MLISFFNVFFQSIFHYDFDQEFEPWLATSEERKDSGLAKPETLAEACSILGESKASWG